MRTLFVGTSNRHMKKLGMLLLLVFACKHERVTVELPDTFNGPHPSTWLPAGMHCGNLIPESLQNQFFPGSHLIERPEMPSQVTCRLAKQPLQREISFICRDEVMLPENLQSASELDGGGARGKPVPGLGRIALAWESSEVKFWDDDTSCAVDILWLDGGERLLPFARALAAHLSPQTLSEIATQ